MTGEEWLAALGVPMECMRRAASAREGGSVVLDVPREAQVLRVHVDGCWIKADEKRVDYLFVIDGCREGRVLVLVEFKGGGHLGDALRQIETTLRHLQSLPAYASGQIARRFAYVIASHGRAVPGYRPKIASIATRHRISISVHTERHEARPC